MEQCQCCYSLTLKSHYIHDEKGALVPICLACFMKLSPVLRQEELRHRNAKVRSAIEVEQLETMWQLDGSWVKEKHYVDR